ncbi:MULTISPECIES: UDP-glucuronic acid decarboxylase family protein [Cyanophyceae]|uniref:UDP-glucuronic acid decarboxylase family protein n=1 Tax=Cyanophyceae TaxID=3028117 RepID=UPI0016881CDE|nr:MULTISPECIES: UDP-glucuronic acid decarboxylase family protein [Cyanophyceae]MBD1915833.1 SDR family oxidoreductase [Phormidium sp. FACHB-77]MBD2030493.1 SDR family oxidoreductase [Phormidium sp. FACHB-322]MBD2053495.1 SDR family oxidoreductase [Leptolyngbya sp. FACHB-60]
MRILVTGGAGFIGSHLIDRLMTEGHEVICLDNFYTGHRHNLLHWFDHPYFEVIRHDVTEPIRLEVDQIYHLACPASPVHYQYNPVKTIKTNVMGTLNMLGLAKRVKARFLLASTSEVYGDPEVHPQTEDYRGNVNPIGIRSCYDEGKRVAETLSFDYHRQNNVDIRVARIFNTYGPRMLENDGRVVSNFVVQALQGIPLTVYGNGSQTRSFCYVSDLVNGLMRLMNGDYIGPVNLGNPDEYTILQLAQTIQAMVNPDTDLVYKPLPQDDPQRRKPDITRAQTFLDWNPTVPLQEGLKLTIDDFRNRLSASGTTAVVSPTLHSMSS